VGSINKTIFRDTQCLLHSEYLYKLRYLLSIGQCLYVVFLCSSVKIQLILKLRSQYDYDYIHCLMFPDLRVGFRDPKSIILMLNFLNFMLQINFSLKKPKMETSVFILL